LCSGGKKQKHGETTHNETHSDQTVSQENKVGASEGRNRTYMGSKEKHINLTLTGGQDHSSRQRQRRCLIRKSRSAHRKSLSSKKGEKKWLLDCFDEKRLEGGFVDFGTSTGVRPNYGQVELEREWLRRNGRQKRHADY